MHAIIIRNHKERPRQLNELSGNSSHPITRIPHASRVVFVFNIDGAMHFIMSHKYNSNPAEEDSSDMK